MTLVPPTTNITLGGNCQWVPGGKIGTLDQSCQMSYFNLVPGTYKEGYTHDPIVADLPVYTPK